MSDTTPANPVGARLRAARQDAGVTLRSLAAAVGVSPATWSAVENGRAPVDEQRLAKAAAALGLTRRALLAQEAASSATDPPPWREFPPTRLPAPLAGALTAFVELGYHGASIRDIAARAGLSVPGVYHHYPSKQHLLVALLDHTMTDLTDRMGRARAEADGPVARLSNLVECLALFHTHHRDLGFVGASEMRAVDEPDRTRIAAARTGVQRMVGEEVAEGCRRGLLSTPLPREAARAVVTMCTALPQWWSPQGSKSAEQVAAEYVRLALSMLGARHRPR